MTEFFPQQRPPWCPHPTCDYLMSTQAVACVGRLPEPGSPHGQGTNTHRLCIHGAKDDGEWTFDLQVNSGDAWGLTRLLNCVRGDTPGGRRQR